MIIWDKPSSNAKPSKNLKFQMPRPLVHCLGHWPRALRVVLVCVTSDLLRALSLRLLCIDKTHFREDLVKLFFDFLYTQRCRVQQDQETHVVAGLLKKGVCRG